MIKTIRSGLLRPILFACYAASIILAVTPGSARAQCPNCICDTSSHKAAQLAIKAEHTLTKKHVDTQFLAPSGKHEILFMVPYFFRMHILAAMQDMTAQLTMAAMEQMDIIGSFLDATQQIETQRTFQELAARAHKDYQSSVEMCSIGTLARSLGSSSRNGEFVASMLARREQDREALNANVLSSGGPDGDFVSRMDLFTRRYCDPHDNDNGLGSLCSPGGPSTGVDKDVDFTRTVLNPLSLAVSFAGGGSSDEQDVFALSNNLYSHDTFQKISNKYLESGLEKGKEGNLQALMDERAVIAKRSVAENSFNAIVGMKAAGTGVSADTARYMKVLLKNLGINPVDAATLVGGNPSYYAQMEMLTKKIYEDPSFFTALYDTPANLARKGAALRAIGLMQHMDMFKSQLRNEAMLSVLAELDVMRLQENVQNRTGDLKPEGAKHLGQ